MFKVWSYEAGCWVGGLVAMFQNGEIVRYSINTKSFDFLGKDKFKIVKYTGFVDSNGKRIYEGAIVEYIDLADCECGNDTYSFMNYGEVYYSETDGYFDISNRNNLDFKDRFQGLTVVGDKYENPTLLKELLKGI